MAAKCDEPNPATPDRRCLNPAGATHADHWDRDGIWPNTEVQQRMELLRTNGTGKRGARGRRKSGMVEIAAAVAANRMGTGGIPVEAQGKWVDDDWTVYAGRTFEEFLKTRTEPFTTAEHVWPLLDRPEEMRALSVVTQRLLRAKYMHEVGAVRLRGVYTTRDGFEFKENKLVPVYESLLCTAPIRQGDAVR